MFILHISDGKVADIQGVACVNVLHEQLPTSLEMWILKQVLPGMIRTAMYRDCSGMDRTVWAFGAWFA